MFRRPVQQPQLWAPWRRSHLSSVCVAKKDVSEASPGSEAWACVEGPAWRRSLGCPGPRPVVTFSAERGQFRPGQAGRRNIPQG